jgi:hypothetical protein
VSEVTPEYDRRWRTANLGVTTQMPVGTVRTEEWRVSWWHWRPDADGPSTPQRLYDNEGEARQHLEGLQSMLADHELRPCGEHVWRPTLERRVVWQGPWQAAGPPA